MHDAGDVLAVVFAHRLRTSEELLGDRALADTQMRHGALARLGGGHPRTIRDTTDAFVLEHEGAESIGEVGAPGLAGNHAGQHRVVPVHRPTMFR